MSDTSRPSSRKELVVKAVERAKEKGYAYEAAAWTLFRRGNGAGVVNVKDFPAVDPALVLGGEGVFWRADEEKPERLFLFSAVNVLRAMERRRGDGLL